MKERSTLHSFISPQPHHFSFVHLSLAFVPLFRASLSFPLQTKDQSKKTRERKGKGAEIGVLLWVFCSLRSSLLWPNFNGMKCKRELGHRKANETTHLTHYPHIQPDSVKKKESEHASLISLAFSLCAGEGWVVSVGRWCG